MNDHSTADRERLLELLADRSLFGLESAEQAELANLQTVHQDIPDDEMDSLVALLSETSPAASTSLPESLRQSILENARPVRGTESIRAAGRDDRGDVTTKKPSATQNSRLWRSLLLVACTAAATLLAVAGLDAWKPTPPSAPEISVAEQREGFLNQATDIVKAEWSAQGDDAATGDVVWSKSLQNGFMTFKGLPINDPKLEQYQLWIFDSERDASQPVDGGVFDVLGEEVVVPIVAKLAVAEATMFAITIEKPGGVVVSKRERLPLLAKVETALP